MLLTLPRKLKQKTKVDKSILQLIKHDSYVLCISLEMDISPMK